MTTLQRNLLWLVAAVAVMGVLVVGAAVAAFFGFRTIAAGNTEQRAKSAAIHRMATTEAVRSAVEEFEAPFRVEAAGQPIDVEVGHAAPLVTDFDADGKPDLLVGQFGGGKLRIFINEGSAAQPRFGAPRWFDGVVPTG